MNLALIPAAGRSSRLGRGKALLPLGGSPLVDVLAETLARGGVDSVTVVVAEGDRDLLEHCRSGTLDFAFNAHPEEGMLSSIRCGLERIDDRLQPNDAIVICPVDFPAVASSTVRRLLDEVAAGAVPLAVPAYRGERGHPVALAASIRPEVDRLDSDVGLRQLRRLHPWRQVEVDDRGVLIDLDTWPDYLKILEHLAP